MIKKSFFSAFALFLFLQGRAQKPEESLINWAEKHPIEKIYLHLDRENYIAGETAWFKAYLYSDYQPDTISTSLYVELLNENGTLLNRSIVPVLLGTASGFFELSDSIPTGSYQVRTYSPTMLNLPPGQTVSGTDFISRKNLFIYGKTNRNTGSETKEKMIRIEFFPEGGNLISGLANAIAFKASNENGLPADVKGKLYNEKNETLLVFSSYHDGMGMFEFTPLSNEKYYALIDGDLSAKKYYLPGQTDKGITLTVIPHPQGNFFDLNQRKDDPAFRVAYMIGQMQHHLVFKQEFKTFKETIQGVINTQHLHSGILQITFFNKDDQPLAERLCFVNNGEYIQEGKLITDTLNLSGKGRNRFSIQLKDTVQGSFSVSITDPDYDLQPVREENIFSSLLLTADLKGYIHNPAFYFTGNNDSIKTALDLVMMTNGWRRFKWTELSRNTSQQNSYKDPAYITLSGKITLRDTKKPFAERPMLLMLITADSTRRIQMISTDKLGNFRLDSMLFFGKSRILFSDIQGKKSKYIDVSMTGDSLTRSFLLPVPERTSFKLTNPLLAGSQSKMAFDYDAIQKASGLMLGGVTVKAKKKNPIQELEEKYASGLFSGDANKTIDLVNNKDAETYANIFDYLQTRVNGLQILSGMDVPTMVNGIQMPSDGSNYQVYYRQGGTASSMGDIPMTLFLDEVQTDASFISTIPANQVAMVKLFSSFVGATSNGAGGVLAIYTKKGADMNDVMQHAADIISYNGYSVTKEFYAPDYAVDKSAKSQTDNRITLDWRPDIFLNNIDPKIPITFYNNDRTKRFKIVVEGMTLQGKMLMIEKIIEGKAF